jgi:DNA-binding XRE family transcriptional regulator
VEEQMKCLECGGAMKTRRESYRYDAVGLPVTLIGVEVSRCPRCGTLVSRRGRLTGAEVRFLRKHLGWTGAELARHLGVQPATVSRWENDAQPVGPVAERLLRLVVARHEPDSAFPLALLRDVADQDARPVRLDFKVGRRGWEPRKAA